MTEPGIERLGALLQQRDGGTTSSRDAASREALVQALTRENSGPSWVRPRMFISTAAFVAACVLVVTLWPDANLRYEVAGGVAEEGYVQASSEPAMISFSDGTSISVAPGGASRIVDVDSHGARVLVEHGEVEARVVPRSAARWLVAAGPYSVAVTGTRFKVSWQPEARRFEVVLIEGSITVRGPMVEPGLAMHAGQRLVARVDDKDLQLSETLAKADETASAPLPTPSPGVVEAAPVPTSATAATAEPVAPAPAPVSWSKLIAEGKYTEVMSLARGMGIGAVLSGGSLEQLVAVGDAARYSGDAGLSQQVLVSLRERFPASASAKTAAFLLGRMAEGGSPGAALSWYDRYLGESPGGAYASEALGRKMMLLSRSQPAQAKTVAQQYLKLYPKGGYANVARTLTKP